MKTFWNNEHASLHLINNPDIPPHMERVKEIVRLWTDTGHRKEGWATKLMREVCTEADGHEYVLLLRPQEYGHSGGLKELPAFYKKFGFVKIQDNPVLMARAPTFNPRKKPMSEAVESLIVRAG